MLPYSVSKYIFKIMHLAGVQFGGGKAYAGMRLFLSGVVRSEL